MGWKVAAKSSPSKPWTNIYQMLCRSKFCFQNMKKIGLSYAFFFLTASCFVLVLYCILDKIWFIVTFQNFLWSWIVRYLKSWTTFNIKYCKLSSGYMSGQWCDFLLCEQNFDIVIALLQWWSCRQQFLMNSSIYPFI